MIGSSLAARSSQYLLVAAFYLHSAPCDSCYALSPMCPGDRWNALDGCIVVMSLAEFLAEAISRSSGFNISFLRVLRLVRLLRVIRLMKTWKGLFKVVSTVLKVGPKLFSLLVLLSLVAFVFALFGMQLFGGGFNPSTGYSLQDCPFDICYDPRLQPKPR